MVKRGPLNKVEYHYIKSNPDNYTVKELAFILERTENQVKKTLKNIEKEQKEQKAQNTQVESETVAQQEPQARTENPKRTMGRGQLLMGRHKRKGKVVATVMSQAASELADETRKSTKVSKMAKDAIHRIFDDE